MLASLSSHVSKKIGRPQLLGPELLPGAVVQLDTDHRPVGIALAAAARVFEAATGLGMTKRGHYKCWSYTADGDEWTKDTVATLKAAQAWCRAMVTGAGVAMSATAEDAEGNVVVDMKRKVAA